MNGIMGILAIGAVLALMHQCKEEDIAKGTPDCIRQEIESIANEDAARNPPAKVYRYYYNGRTVYFIPQYCCDFPSKLFDEDCNLLCSPDGGFSGRGDNKCPDFFDMRKGEVLVWEDTRDQ